MVPTTVRGHDRDMTETPQQDSINREHLRDYSQLRRSVTDRKVAGVAGGLGRHLNIDPTILRVAFVVLAFFGGAGFLLYGVLWLFVPEDGRDEAVISTSAGSRNAVIVVAGVLAALLLIGDSWGGFGFPWPLAVVALVLVLFLTNRDKPVSATYNPPPPQESGAQPGPPPPPPAGTEAPTTPAEAGPYTAPYSGSVPPTTAPYPVQQPPAPRPDRGPKLFWFTAALLAVALGALGLYDVSGGSVVDSAYPALALAVIGAMLVVGAWFGRPGGLIALGVVAALALLATSATQPRFAGERWIQETPTRATQVESRYFVPAGSLDVDMSNIHDIARLDGKTVHVGANAGDIVVTLPEGVDVDVDTNITGAGEITVLDETTGGVGRVSLDRSVDGGPDAPQMNLDIDLAVGNIEVRQ
jgi:phage shock protein PspC (stress-responsive transcriptional regulator)